jgi:membrane protein YdbS with pleckstrin-like domain
MSQLLTSSQLISAVLFVSSAVLWCIYEVIYSIQKRSHSARDNIEEQPLQAQEKESSRNNLFGVSETVFALRRWTVLGLLMGIMYLSEFHPLFPHGIKTYNHATLAVMILGFMVLGFIGMTRVRKEDTADEIEREKCNLLLNRDQTEEWKGWMQYIFLMYHYTHAEDIYGFVRMLVSCYVWMTGFGNYSFFYIYGDYSFARLWKVMWRLNFSVILLCMVMNNSYVLYYIVPLHTFYFVLVALTMYIQNKYNKNKWVPRAKIAILGLVIFFIWDVPGVFRSIITLFGWMNVSPNMHELHFRTYLDHYSALFGMIFAMNFPIMRKWLQIVNLRSKTDNKAWWYWATTITLCSLSLLLWFWYILASSTTKFVYNSLHPYFVTIPIAGYILLRNCTPMLRNRYSTVFRYLGKITLETYLLQHHLFLSTNAKKLLIIFPYNYAVNFLIIGAVFVAASHLLFKLTMDLRDVYSPEVKNKEPEEITRVNAITWSSTKMIIGNLCLLYVFISVLQLFFEHAWEIIATGVVGTVAYTLLVQSTTHYLLLGSDGNDALYAFWTKRYALFGVVSSVIVFVAKNFKWIITDGEVAKGYIGSDMFWGTFVLSLVASMLLLYDSYCGLLSETIKVLNFSGISFQEAYSMFQKKEELENDKPVETTFERHNRMRILSGLLFGVIAIGICVAGLYYKPTAAVQSPSPPIQNYISDIADAGKPDLADLAKCNQFASPDTVGVRLVFTRPELGVIKSGTYLHFYMRVDDSSDRVRYIAAKVLSDTVEHNVPFDSYDRCYHASIRVVESGNYTITGVFSSQRNDTDQTIERMGLRSDSPIEDLQSKRFEVVDQVSLFSEIERVQILPGVHSELGRKMSYGNLTFRWVNQEEAIKSLKEINLDTSKQRVYRDWIFNHYENNQVYLTDKYLLQHYSFYEMKRCLNRHYPKLGWYGDSNTRRLIMALLLEQFNSCDHADGACMFKVLNGDPKAILRNTISDGGGRVNNLRIGLAESYKPLKIPIKVDEVIADTTRKGAVIENKFLPGLPNLKTTPTINWEYVYDIPAFKDPQSVKLIIISAGNWDIAGTYRLWQLNIDKLSALLKEKFVDHGIPVVFLGPHDSEKGQQRMLEEYSRRKMVSVGVKYLDGLKLGLGRGRNNNIHMTHYPTDRLFIELQLLFNMICNDLE